MAAANKVPDNLNYLSNISFRLAIEDAPHLTWFCQAANVPGVSIPNIELQILSQLYSMQGLKLLLRH